MALPRGSLTAEPGSSGDTTDVSLVVTVLLSALLVGRLSNGSLDGLGQVRLRTPGLVAAALVVQLAGTLIGGPAHPAGLALSSGLAVAFLLRNRKLAGTGLVAAGLLANAVVIGANGAMPVSLGAAERAGAPVEQLLAGTDPRHELAGDATRLRWLADVIPVRLPVRPEVVSAGDVLVAAGLAQLVVVAMRTSPTRRARRTGRQRRALPPRPDTAARPATAAGRSSRAARPDAPARS